MTLKPNGKDLVLKEQILDDLVTGLTIQFEQSGDGTTRLRLFGEILPLGNREIIFTKEGIEAGGGTILDTLRRPYWLAEVDSKRI